MKNLYLVGLSISATVLVAAVFAAAVPDYEVETSVKNGQCKKVEYQGNKVPDGCHLVAVGKITRYTHVQGY